MIKHRINYIGFLIGVIVILLTYEGSSDLLNWLYESDTYKFIEKVGSYIAGFWLLNLLFICMTVFVYVKLLTYMYNTKVSGGTLTLLCALACLLCNGDEVRYGGMLMPKLTYQMFWFMLVLILAIVEMSKLLGYYFDEEPKKKNTAARDASMQKKHQEPSPTSVFFDEYDSNIGVKESKLHVDENHPEDYLGRIKEAELLAKYILDNPNYEHAIGVAVTGEWGSGKTVFLNYLSDAFEAKNIVPMRFDPWQEQSENIPGDFFGLIKKELDEEGKDLVDALMDYLQSLKVTTTNNWFSLTVMTLKHYLDKDSLTVAETKNRLAALLADREKPLVVFIDDCDRLDTESLKQTISLIRTIADLPHLVIVAAYDSNRVDGLMQVYGGVGFLKKMFNVTHSLSKVDERFVQSYIRDQIRYNHNYPIEGFTYPFDSIKLTDYLPTLRDCKLYLNQLQDALAPYYERKDMYSLDWGALCLLQLLKYHDAYLYERLRSDRLSILELHKDRDPKDELYLLRSDIDVVTTTLNLLRKIFNYGASDDYFDIPGVPECFDAYFNPVVGSCWLTEDEFKGLMTDDVSRISNIKSYLTKENTNFKPLLAERIYNGLQNEETDAIALLVETVEAYAREKIKYESQYSRQYTTFELYMDVLHEHQYLGALADRVFQPKLAFSDDQTDIVGDYFNDTIYLLASLALMSDVIANTTDKLSDDLVMHYFCKLMHRVTNEVIDLETRVWICGTITSPRLYDDYLTVFLEMHFMDLISMTLTLDSGQDGYVIAKHDGMKALFDTNERYQRFIAKWIERKAFDVNILKQHKDLVFMTSMLNPKNKARFDVDNYPELKPFMRDDDFTCKFEEIKLRQNFWRNESRLKEKNDFVPIMDANK